MGLSVERLAGLAYAHCKPTCLTSDPRVTPDKTHGHKRPPLPPAPPTKRCRAGESDATQCRKGVRIATLHAPLEIEEKGHAPPTNDKS